MVCDQQHRECVVCGHFMYRLSGAVGGWGRWWGEVQFETENTWSETAPAYRIVKGYGGRGVGTPR